MKYPILPLIVLAVISLTVISLTTRAETLMQATTSWDGGEIAYPDGQAEITAFVLKIKEGQEPPFHCHPVPTFGRITKGSIEVETSDGKKKRMHEGETLIEVMNTVHRGIAVGGPVEILVFYAGAEGIPNTVMADDPKAKKYCH